MSRRVPAQMTVLSDGRYALLAKPTPVGHSHPRTGEDLIGLRIVRVVPVGGGIEHEYDLRAVSNVYEDEGWELVRVADEAAYYAALSTGAPLPSGEPVQTHEVYVERRVLAEA